ncbi:YARHG domain-containing protein [Flavobacterium sp.]|uniref:YARHG domain-containing protein n=1 Tax=Flavobacterium sp. TaxID=239 RepID=UPI002614FD94|nr:YARHG domain-containing protein [Flavobacterium sp.]
MKKIFFLLLIFSCLSSGAQTAIDCANCSVQIVKREQIKGLSIDEIQFLTNDLVARKGYKFKSGVIEFYYSNKVWYKPMENNDKIIYNEIEKRNIKTFQDKIIELKEDRENLLSKLKAFKVSMLREDKEFLKSEFGFSKQSEVNKLLLEVLNRINLDKVNWFKKYGHYQLKEDNLTETISYKIIINDNQVSFVYNYDSGSEDVEENMYSSDFDEEFTHFWEFEWKKDELKFLKFYSAG